MPVCVVAPPEVPVGRPYVAKTLTTGRSTPWSCVLDYHLDTLSSTLVKYIQGSSQ